MAVAMAMAVDMLGWARSWKLLKLLNVVKGKY